MKAKNLLKKTKIFRPGAVKFGAGLFSALLVSLLIFNSAGNNVVRAYTTWNQTDWSGGQSGTPDPSNQYLNGQNIIDSNSGEISLDQTTSQWCDTSKCDNNWTKRKALWINNYAGDAVSEAFIQINVPYDSDMQSNFNDLRFTPQDGGSDLDYYILSYDGDSANIILRYSGLGGFSLTTAYMYYGNSGATAGSTTDTLLFSDKFDSGTLDAQWSNPSGGQYSLDNGEITLNDNALLMTSTTWPRDYYQVFEADIKIDTTGLSCDDWNYLYDFILTQDLMGYSGFITDSMCDNINGHSLGVTGTPAVNSDSWVRIRGSIPNNSNQLKLEYSLDEGLNYTEFLTESNVSSDQEATFGFQNYDGANSVKLKRIISYYDSDLDASMGIEETVGGKSGSILSGAYDLGSDGGVFGNVTVDTSGTGITGIIPFSSADGGISFDPRLCPILNSGDSMTDSNCVTEGNRYIYILVLMSEPPGGSFTLNDVNFQYNLDTSPPATNASDIVIKTSSSGDVITEGSWSTDPHAYFSWTAGDDGVDGSGIKGYCLYFGTDSSADPLTTKGMISNDSLLDTNNTCPYANANTHLEINYDVSVNNIQNGETYYFKVKAIDNLNYAYSGEAASTNYKIDFNSPTAATVFTIPSTSPSKTVHMTWLTNLGTGFFDGESGVAGLKYCVTNALIGFSGCDYGDSNWYGATHSGNGSLTDTSDVIPFSAGGLTTVPADFDRMDDSVAFANFIAVVVVDNVGNHSSGNQGLVLIKSAAPGGVTNLTATPTSNTTNSFSFSWDPPLDNTYVGSANTLDYCWSVNEAINEDASNCSWTGPGITSLAQGPYATQQGVNTLYIVTKDQIGVLSNDNMEQVTFSASTSAPGIPQDLEISDVSTRATSTWKLAMSWSAPTQVGAGVASYKILRSTDNENFTQVGSTSSTNLSFIDSGLDQVTYFYKIKACDNAGSCGIASDTASRTPTGRYTTPASLTADSDQPKVKDIGTRKASIFWFTNRNSDSKVSYGTRSGDYFPEEIGNSNQVSDHQVNLTNLQPNTTYYYVAKWTDLDGNTGTSTERTFTTLPAPSVREVTPSNIKVDSVDITFKTKDSSKVDLLYGRSEGFGGIKSINTSEVESTYSIHLSDLEDGSKYFVKLNTYDADGNVYSGDLYTFTTLARPRITNLRFQPVEGSPSSTQKVTWNTNVLTNSSLVYGPKGGKQLDALNSTMTTDHEMTIVGLEDDTDYTLVARSQDASGNTAVSDTQSFHTELDTRPPKITDVNVETSIRGTGTEARGQIIVSWKTDEKSTSQVEYGQGQSGAFTNRTTSDSKLTTEHVVVISDLAVSNIYHIRVVSNDKAGNPSNSDSQTAIIGRGSDNVFSIIFNALRKIFGIKD